MEQTQGQTGMVFYNYNAVDGILTSSSTPVQIEFGSADVARQINQQVQLQYSNLQGIQPGQTQQIVITTQPTFDTTEDIDPILIKGSKTKVRSNGERVPCQLCGKTFSCNANLRDHLRLHTGERPFQCAECGLSFAQRSNWRLHKRVHTGERPYMCGICGKTFSRSSHLPGHIRVHTGERPFQCNNCDHSFSSSQALKNHVRTHTGEKPFSCDACSTTFTHSSTLSSHRKRCTGEKRKRGRPVGSGRRRKRSLNRPRGRPKKGRFGRRRKKTEDADKDIKEEMGADKTDSICEVDVSEINCNNAGGSSVVDMSATVLNSVSDKHDIQESLLCDVTESSNGDTLLCKITESDNGEALLCKITEVANGESLLCNVGETNNENEVLCNIEGQPFPMGQDVKPMLDHDVVKVAAMTADLANGTDLKPNMSRLSVPNELSSNISHLSHSRELRPDISGLPHPTDLPHHIAALSHSNNFQTAISTLAEPTDLHPTIAGSSDPSDLRQEAAVAMTTLHHSVINNLPIESDQQTF